MDMDISVPSPQNNRKSRAKTKIAAAATAGVVFTTTVLTAAQRQADSIKRAVQEETHNHIHTLSVRVTPHQVFLCGWCSSYYYKQLAQHAAMASSGRKNLRNEIVVVD